MPSRRVMRFLADRRGSTTVEFVLWLPFFFGLLAILVDATLLMHRQTEMYDVARATSRQVSLGLMDAAAAEAFAQAQIGGAAQIVVQGGLVTSSLSLPFSQVLMFSGTLAPSANLSASVTMVREVSDEE